MGVILLSNYDGQSAVEMVEIADGLLDIGQGREPNMPKRSILVPLPTCWTKQISPWELRLG